MVNSYHITSIPKIMLLYQVYKSIFKNLKKIVTKALILVYYKQNLKTIVKIYTFDYVSSEVFFQLGKDKLLYFIIFFSKNLYLVKYNYKIYNKELFIIICYFEQ